MGSGSQGVVERAGTVVMLMGASTCQSLEVVLSPLHLLLWVIQILDAHEQYYSERCRVMLPGWLFRKPYNSKHIAMMAPREKGQTPTPAASHLGKDACALLVDANRLQRAVRLQVFWWCRLLHDSIVSM